MESGRNLLNKSSPLAFCILGYEILSTTLGMGDWISDGDNDDLLFGNCISDGDNDDSLVLFHEIARQQELQNGYSVRSPTYQKSIRTHSSYNGKFYGNNRFP